MDELKSDEPTNLSKKGLVDYLLIKRAIEHNDQKAYDQLVARYYSSLYFMLLKMLRNKEDADDVAMESLQKAFKRLSQYRPEYAFSTWLFKIASNSGIDFIRKKKNEGISYSIDRNSLNEDGFSIGKLLKDAALDPEEIIIKKEKIKLLRTAVDKLKPRFKVLIEYRYFSELSYDEIAVKTDLPIGTIKAQLFRAKEALYNLLKTSEKKRK